jgi:hypothetical protein
MTIESRERLEWKEKSLRLATGCILVAMRTHDGLLLGQWSDAYRATCELHERIGQLHKLATRLAATPGDPEPSIKLVHGIPPAIRAVRNLPDGRVSFNFKEGQLAIVTVEVAGGAIRSFWIREEEGDRWVATQFTAEADRMETILT